MLSDPVYRLLLGSLAVFLTGGVSAVANDHTLSYLSTARALHGDADLFDKGENCGDALPWEYTHGVKKVLLVRVTGNQDETLSADEMRLRVFGNGKDELNAASAYNRCTLGALTIEAFEDKGDINRGLLEIHLDEKTSGKKIYPLQDKASKKAKEHLGGTYDGTYFVIMVMPFGMTFGGQVEAIAFGRTRTVYKSETFRHYQIMHELGHNLGLAHSTGEGTLVDGTGLLGYGHTRECKEAEFFSQNCYNIVKYHKAQWFTDRHEHFIPLDQPYWEGHLVGIAAYEPNTNGPPILLRITGGATNDYFVGFNNAVGRTKGVCTYRDRVIIYQQPHTRRKSILVAELGAGESYTDPHWDERGLNIVVNTIDTSSETGIVHVKVFANCFTDDDCDNGNPCDGVESCSNSVCVKGPPKDCEAPSALPSRLSW